MVKTRFYLPLALVLYFCTALSAQYLESFTGQNGKGLVDAICPAGTNNINNCGSACTANATDNTSTCSTVPPSLTGVNWTIGLGPSSSYFTDPNPNPFGFEFGSPDDFGVVGEKIQVDDPDQEICWISPTLNIGSAGAVSISVGVSQTGGLETGDFVRGDYSLNGGAFVQFGFQEGNFAAANLTVSGLSGSTLVIRVCAKTNGGGEQIFIDDISVPQAGVTTGCAAPSIGTVVSQAGTCNPNSGAIQVTANGGTPGYNVAWSGPSSGNPGGTEIASSGGSYNISGLAAGAYTITVTDAASCSATSTATVTTATALSLSTQLLPADCPGASTGEIDLTVNNGVPPYSYSWSNLPGSGDPQDQIGLAAGSYTVTVTDNASCTSTTSATVGTAAAGAYSETFSIDGKGILDNSTCSGANGTTCTNNNFVGVNWSIYGLPDLAGIDVNDYFKTTGGKLEAKDLDGTACWESPLLDINPPGTGVAFSVGLVWNDFDQEPAQDFIDVEYSLDGGAWTRVPNQVGGGTSGHTIVYANGAGNDVDGSTTVNVSGLSGSTLRIRVCGNTNSESELFSIDNVSVPSSQGLYCPCPAISFTATPTNTCPGSNNGQIAVSNVTGGSGPYMYSKDNGLNFQSSATFTGLAANNYQIVVKDATACTGGPQSVTVGTFTAPSCSISGADYVCNNTAGITYTATAGMSAYNWNISGAGSIPGSTSGQSVSVTSGNYLDNYTVFVTITDNNGCTNTCSKQSNIFLFKPPADITVNPNPACFGVTLDLSVSAAASSTVAWTGEGITNPSGNPSTTALPVSPGLKTYSVIITTDYGCSNTGTVDVTVNPNPTTPTITGPTSVCSGGSVTLDAGAGYNSYAWSNGGGGGQTANFNNITSTTTYTVTVTGANGCTGTDTHTVTVNPSPGCSIIFTNPPPWGQDTTCANSTGNVYSAPGGMSAYNWSISGSGSITSVTNGSSVTVTAGNSGSYNLAVTVTNANGCTSTCMDNTPIKPAPTCSLSGPTSVNCNSPGNVYSVSNGAFPISSYSWSVSGDAMISGPSNGSSVTVTAGTSNFSVNVTSVGFNACPSFCSQSVTVLPCNIDFSGQIIFSNDNSLGVENANVALTGSATGSDLSDTNGDFSISTTVSSGSFTLTPAKTVNKLNGVTAGDVTAIQQHVANITPITDLYKQVAADVNKSNSITSTDASIINQSLLGNPAALAQFKTSWRFAPTSYTMTSPPWGFPEKRTYTNINTSQTNQDFYGIKTGDVVTTYANPANFGAGQPLVLQEQDRLLQAGETFSVEFSAGQMDDLAAFQCALRFDPEQLQFVELQPLTGLPLAMDNFGTYNIAEGEIRLVWAQATGVAVAEAAPVFSIQFTALQSGAQLSDVLQLDESELPALAYNGALAESKLELIFSELTVTGNPADAAGVRLLQNRPNPFSGTTAIGFVLPEACEAQLRVFDVSGRLLAERRRQYPAGKNEEIFEANGTTGVLYYELTTPFGVLAKKMTASE